MVLLLVGTVADGVFIIFLEVANFFFFLNSALVTPTSISFMPLAEIGPASSYHHSG